MNDFTQLTHADVAKITKNEENNLRDERESNANLALSAHNNRMHTWRRSRGFASVHLISVTPLA